MRRLLVCGACQKEGCTTHSELRPVWLKEAYYLDNYTLV
jgi:hypothetical protein